MEQSIFKKLIKKYEQGKVNAAEQYIVDRWYDSFEGEIPVIPGLENDEHSEMTRVRMLKGISYHRSVSRWYQRDWMKIAAALILMCSAISLWYLKTINAVPHEKLSAAMTVFTGDKEIKKIQLSDSSEVWLNANSKLEILKGYSSQKRNVKLSGEAFFKVKRDKRHPFEISTPLLKVKVLGTSFNVSAYKNIKNTRVAVSTGKVQVSNGSHQLSLLTAGMDLIYNSSSRSYRVINTVVKDNDSWISGRKVLSGASFEELSQAFYNAFAVKLVSTDSEVRSFKYYLTVHSGQSKKTVLDIICTLTKKKYRKEENDRIVLY